MTSHEITEAELDASIARAFGRGDATPMSPSDAAYEIDAARTFGRKPTARALEAAKHAEAVQEAERDLAPWRAAVRWDKREELLSVEGTLAELVSSRRGQTAEAARAHVATLLREAWAKGGKTDHDRMVAVGKTLNDSIAQFQKLPPITGHSASEASSRPVRIVVSEVER